MQSSNGIKLSTLSSNSHGMQAITSPDIEFIGGEPPDKKAICIVQTVGGRAMICEWGDGSGLVAWHPLPKLWKANKPKSNHGLLSSDKPQVLPAA
jgi:hypothetical protein